MENHNQFKILHVAETLPGGVGSYLSEVVASQIRIVGPHRLRLAVTSDERNALPDLPDECFRCFRKKGRSLRELARFARSVIRTIIEERPDIVHLHSTFAGLLRPLLSVLPKSRRPRVIYCAHGWAFNMRWPKVYCVVFTMLERRLAHLCDRILCISQFEYDSAIEHRIPARNMEVLHNGVTQRIGPGGQLPMPMPGNVLNLVFLGRKDEQKGFDVAEKAMGLLLDYPVHLHVVGACVLSAGKRSIENTVNITHYGWQPRAMVWSYIEGADAILMPSRWEGFGLAAIEGMRQGKPILASRVDALPEVVREGVSGLLFEPEDPEGLARLIRSLDKEDLEQLGRNAREDFLARFTGEKMNDRIMEVYREVLENSPVNRRRRA